MSAKRFRFHPQKGRLTAAYRCSLSSSSIYQGTSELFDLWVDEHRTCL